MKMFLRKSRGLLGSTGYERTERKTAVGASNTEEFGLYMKRADKFLCMVVSFQYRLQCFKLPVIDNAVRFVQIDVNEPTTCDR